MTLLKQVTNGALIPIGLLVLPIVHGIPVEMMPEEGIPFVVAHVDSATSTIIYDQTSISRALILALLILLSLIAGIVFFMIAGYTVQLLRQKRRKIQINKTSTGLNGKQASLTLPKEACNLNSKNDHKVPHLPCYKEEISSFDVVEKSPEVYLTPPQTVHLGEISENGQ
ncbi:hypothetical protein K7432_007582 [Basidiobolus ranarum]|uniref:Uncharacterized protein n=1 Tax=Basidiobolus ranarum TaxID=34480 RepID=A0ABR2WT60_9FUNG